MFMYIIISVIAGVIAVLLFGLICSAIISLIVIRLQEKWYSAVAHDETKAKTLKDTYDNKYKWNNFELDVLKLLEQKNILINTRKPDRVYIGKEWFGDFGGDILGDLNTLSCVVQCKLHSVPERAGLSDEQWEEMKKNDSINWTKTSIEAVHDVYLARAFYEVSCAMIVTNTSFTDPAKIVAKDLGVILVDNEVLDGIFNNDRSAISERMEFLQSSFSRPRWLTELLYFLMKRRVTFSKYQRRYSTK